MKFFITMFAVFFARVKPASTSAKPACIRNTRIPAITIHSVSTDNATCSTVGAS